MFKYIFKRLYFSLFSFLAGFVYLVLSAMLLLVIWIFLFKADPTDNISLFAVAEIAVLFFFAFIAWIIGKLLNKDSLLDLLASRPGKQNYNWQGGYSIFIFLILALMTILRSVSILQFSKVIYRLVAEPDTDTGSKRPNVPPSFQELYIVIWAVFLVFQISLKISNHILFALDVYFIIESVTWILYYAVFRRFFEEKYSIYHVLEHLPIIFIMIPLQAIAYAASAMCGGDKVSWREIIPTLLGQATENRIMLSVLGFLYSAIVVSMIISTFPVENVKTGNPETIIIGAGDVVKNRLFPAIIQRTNKTEHNRIGNISIYDRKELEIEKNWNIKEKASFEIPQKTKTIYSLITEKIKSKDIIAWIETPSDSHLYYLELLKNQVSFIAIEKPMVSSKSDFIKIKEFISSSQREKVFFLSYYILEKALPLTFLMRPNSFYAEYLDGNLKEYYQAFLELGKIKKVSIAITEAYDCRDLPSGGQLIETFIHHCLIASLFAGLPCTWTDLKFETFKNDKQTKIHLSALGEKKETIDLQLVKGFDQEYPNKNQSAILEFDKGMIRADFNKKTAEITTYNTESGKEEKAKEVSIKSDYEAPYAVQCDMVYRCYANHISPSSIDGLYHQAEVLEWLIDHYSGE